MSAKLLPVNDVADLVDEVGRLRTEIASLTKRKDELTEMLKDTCIEHAGGADCSITISYSIASPVTDWKKIAIDLGASRQRIAGNTSISFYDRVTVSARSVK